MQLIGNEFIASIRTVYYNQSIYVIAKSAITEYSPGTYSAFLLLLKIDIVDGHLVGKKKYKLNDSVVISKVFNNSARSYTVKGVISDNFIAKYISNESLLIAGRKGENFFDNNRFFTIKLDSNLKLVKYKLLRFDDSFSFFYTSREGYHASISNDGHTLFSLMRDTVDQLGNNITSNNAYSFLLDKKLNIISQQKQSLLSSGLNNLNGFQKNVSPFIIKGNSYELIYYPTGSQGDSLLYISKISPNILSNSCMGFTTKDLIEESPGATEITFPDYSESPFIVTSQQYPVPITDERIAVNKFCRQINICDTIKIKGNSKYCLSTPSATFTLYKKPQCLYKINWIVDSNFIKIDHQPNDTTINVRFLKSFHGYIKAAFEGCVLKDSLYIDVNMPQQNLSLGKDTMLCPNKTIVLNAGNGFKTYLWQDGSNSQTYYVTKPGTYFVSATDSCDNIFKDTVIVKPMDVSMSINYPGTLCRYDTATLSLDSKLMNYTLAPVMNTTLSSNNLKLFPDVTTLFTISGERFHGCVLSDTLLIKVMDCPVYIYFPNAFTPERNGINDTFKPTISGKIEQYQLEIYNKYGQLVFKTRTKDQGWDGSLKSSLQDSGIFVWYCHYNMKNEVAKFQKGTVLLIK